MEVEKKRILIKLKEIINKRFNINIDIENDTIIEENLLGKRINMKTRELLYLFFEIQNEFNIRIPQEKINNTFNTLCNITDIIYTELSKKNNLDIYTMSGI